MFGEILKQLLEGGGGGGMFTFHVVIYPNRRGRGKSLGEGVAPKEARRKVWTI